MTKVEFFEDPMTTIAHLRLQHRDTWRDMSEGYWLARLMQEVGELATALVDPKPGDDDPDHELAQIAAICANWMYYRKDMQEHQND